MDEYRVSWDEVFERLARMPVQGVRVWGIPRGGQIVAGLLAASGRAMLAESAAEADVVVDDILDSGATRKRYIPNGARFAVLVDKPGEGLTSWVHLPWDGEHETGAEDAVRRLIQLMGQDPDREGLRDTPSRVCRALVEMTAGYHESAEEVLARVFESPRYDELVVVKGVRFTSMCEHHLLPFTGEATVGYLPSASGKVVGLSKLARLVQVYARRLQLQEQMTRQISDAIMRHLGAKAAGVVVRAKHSCMGCRGAKQPDAEMVTSSMQGDLRTNAALRAEFLALAK